MPHFGELMGLDEQGSDVAALTELCDDTGRLLLDLDGLILTDE